MTAASVAAPASATRRFWGATAPAMRACDREALERGWCPDVGVAAHDVSQMRAQRQAKAGDEPQREGGGDREQDQRQQARAELGRVRAAPRDDERVEEDHVRRSGQEHAKRVVKVVTADVRAWIDSDRGRESRRSVGESGRIEGALAHPEPRQLVVSQCALGIDLKRAAERHLGRPRSSGTLGFSGIVRDAKSRVRRPVA